jgi:hypothetical protein
MGRWGSSIVLAALNDLEKGQGTVGVASVFLKQNVYRSFIPSRCGFTSGSFLSAPQEMRLGCGHSYRGWWQSLGDRGRWWPDICGGPAEG